jgi:hypothetical protein
MNSINPRQASHDQPNPTIYATDAETTPRNKSERSERGMACGMGRSGGFVTLAIVATAAVVVVGLSFGWSGWLTASAGGISLLFLLPCLAMGVGMMWMMIREGNDQSPKVPDHDPRP